MLLQGKSQSGTESSNGSLLVCCDLCGTGHYAIKIPGMFQVFSSLTEKNKLCASQNFTPTLFWDRWLLTKYVDNALLQHKINKI